MSVFAQRERVPLEIRQVDGEKMQASEEERGEGGRRMAAHVTGVVDEEGEGRGSGRGTHVNAHRYENAAENNRGGGGQT